MVLINSSVPPVGQIVDVLSAVHQRIANLKDLSCSANHGVGLLALLAHTLFQLTADAKWQQVGRIHLSDGVALVSQQPLNTSFFSSAPGFAWVVAKLWQDLAFEDGPEIVESIANAYEQVLAPKPAIGFDLINGLAGLTVFARIAPARHFQSIMDHVWRALQDVALKTPGFGWVGVSNTMVDDTKADLGIAHGAPGVLAGLSAALNQGWNCPQAEAAIGRGGQWLREKQIDVAGQAGYPYFVGENHLARLGWCYGMPSSAICFAWLAARDPQFLLDAMACGISADMMRQSSQHGITDACICHGEAAWGYIGARLIESFGDAATEGLLYNGMQTCQARIAAMYKESLTGTIPHFIHAAFRIQDTLLEGAAGPWLAMAGLHNERCRTWEGMLLLDFPQSRQRI